MDKDNDMAECSQKWLHFFVCDFYEENEMIGVCQGMFCCIVRIGKKSKLWKSKILFKIWNSRKKNISLQK